MLPYRAIAESFSLRRFGWGLILAFTVKGMISTALIILAVLAGWEAL